MALQIDGLAKLIINFFLRENNICKFENQINQAQINDNEKHKEEKKELVAADRDQYGVVSFLPITIPL